MSNQTKPKATPIKRFGYLLGTIFTGIITYMTATGDLQNHIYFAGVLNEIGFFVMGCMLTGIFAICTCTE